MNNRYTVKLISKRTGLSPQLIRTWEKRYGAVEPQRSSTNRRLYSETDLEKLMLLKRATSMGLSISTIANLTIAELYELVDKRDITKNSPEVNGSDDSSEYHLKNCLAAIEAFDYAGLESALLNASSSLGQQVFIEHVIHPLMLKTGEYWHTGEFQIAQEHMVSTLVRSLLGSMLVSGRTHSDGPLLLVTTPSRQMHELGALMSAVTALSAGWNIVYLGANLPVEEITNAAYKHTADAIALSITYPVSDPVMEMDLRRFRKLIGDDIPILIGGQGAVNFVEVIEEIAATHIADLTMFKNELARITPLSHVK